MERFVLLVILALWAVSGMVASSRSEMVDSVVAVVNGEVITLSMVEDAILGSPSARKKKDSENAIWTDPQEIPKSLQDALQKLIDHKLMLQEARSRGVIVSEENLAREVAKVVSRFASPEKFSEALQQRGITQEDLEESLIEEIMIREMINRKFRNFVEATEGEASGFFEQHREEYVMPEAVHLDQVFFQLSPNADEATKETVRENAEEVFRKLRNGADFSSLGSPGAGKKESDLGPPSAGKKKESDLGPPSAGKRKESEYAIEAGTVDYVVVDQLIPVVAAAVSRLEVGEISDLIETPVGYFIIKLNDRRPTRQAAFSEVKEDIKALLIQQKTEAELEAWLKKERELADIRMRT